MFQKMAKQRHSGMDAGIQAQGRESIIRHSAASYLCGAGELPSMALDTGIHAGMTALAEKSF